MASCLGWTSRTQDKITCLRRISKVFCPINLFREEAVVVSRCCLICCYCQFPLDPAHEVGGHVGGDLMGGQLGADLTVWAEGADLGFAPT